MKWFCWANRELRNNAEELADNIGTIPYEIVCIIGKRPVYFKNGKIVNVLNYLI